MKQRTGAFLLYVMPFLSMAQTFNLPDVIPPSPQATEMVKYIDFPVDMSTGLATIDIPLYVVNSKELSLPISLSYQSSGLKPNEAESGVIGLGWNLNAFGIVSRSIRKQPDEKYWNYLIPMEESISSNTNNLVADPDAVILDDLARGNKESEPDIFSYSLPGKAGGKFVLKRSSILSEFLSPVTLPFRPLQIKPNMIQQNFKNIFDCFEIIDENGIFYRFGKSVATGKVYYENYFDANNSNQTNGISSWLLTEIISADKSDTIYFEYSNVLHSSGDTLLFKRSHKINKSVSITHGLDGETHQFSQNGVYTGYGYSQKKLTLIKFKSGYVKLLYKSDMYPDHLLDRLEIYSKNSALPVRIIRFFQTKYHNNPSLLNWYKLDAVKYYNDQNEEINNYSFTYYTTAFPTIHSTLTHETESIDFQGYYNGAGSGNSPGLQPPNNFTWNPLPTGGSANLFGDANRSPYYSLAMAGILTGMINPNGGEHIFEYEGNSNYQGQPVGGVRIRKIINKTGGEEIRKTFTYSGMSLNIDQNFFQSHFAQAETTNVTDIFTASADPNIDISLNGSPVIYHKVTEYFGDETVNNGWIEHYFDGSIISPVKYDYWSITRGYPWFNGNGQFSYGPLPVHYRDLVFGTIFEEETKVFGTSGNHLMTTKHHYSHELKQRLNGFSVSRVVSAIPLPLKAYFFIFYNYNIDQLAQRLDSTVVTDYSGGTPHVTRDKYTYNDDLQVIQKRRQDSDGLWKITEYKYPKDFVSVAPYNKMVNERNMIAPVIEQFDYVESNFLQSVKTNYKEWYSNVIAPDFVQTKVGANSPESRLRYHNYDVYGNVLSVSKENDVNTCYIWGYEHSYPVAKIVGVDYNTAYSILTTFQKSALVNPSSDQQVRDIIQVIRSHPSMANTMVYTYTFDPLVGMTSMVDENNQVTFFEYDSANRLHLIKDANEHILKMYDYNYQEK